MEQRSEKWFAARKGRVTGSMVGAVLGLDPNCTRAEAMRRMVRSWQGLPSEFQGNIATNWGINHEDEAREAFEYKTQLAVQPATFVVHPTMDWLGASPDGLVLSEALIEIKCPFGLRAHDAPVPFKSIEEQPHYYAQMQIQMLVTGRDFCYFWQWTPNDSKLDGVTFDPSWINENLPKLEEFYQEFLSICDDEIEDFRPAIDNPRALQLLAEYDDLQDAILRADERKSEILADIIAMCGGKNSTVCGRKLSKVEKAGSISYAKAIKELAPNADLERWRGKPSSYWMLK